MESRLSVLKTKKAAAYRLFAASIYWFWELSCFCAVWLLESWQGRGSGLGRLRHKTHFTTHQEIVWVETPASLVVCLGSKYPHLTTLKWLQTVVLTVMVCFFWFYFVGFIPMCRPTSCLCIFSSPLFYVHLWFICSFTLWLVSVSFSSLFDSFVPGITLLAPPVSCPHVFAVPPVFPQLHPVL